MNVEKKVQTWPFCPGNSRNHTYYTQYSDFQNQRLKIPLNHTEFNVFKNYVNLKRKYRPENQ